MMTKEPQTSNYHDGKFEKENESHVVEVRYVKTFGSKEEAAAWIAANNTALEKAREKAAPTKATQHQQNLRKDDQIKIVGGTHKGKVGAFVRMTERRAKVKVDGAERAIKVEFVEALTIPPRGDRANIAQGKRVRIVGGEHKGKAATYVKETNLRVLVKIDGVGGRYLKKDFVIEK